ncbi:MAG TPA: aminoacyl-histidine dipeptidase [Sediminispirochaeta sp.]|nr:aminoacyl-histidine dipeptidase [Sediminispirochaeta sp.]
MAKTTLNNIDPQRVLHYFEEISQIPRCSGHEAALRDYLKKFAETHQLAWQEDRVGNLVIRKPGTPSLEDSPTVVLQGHMDMVCEKNTDTKHDFLNDPIKLKVDGDWLRAEGTTLGADNGVAVAMGLAVLESETIEHGPLEVLLTVDEESGLTGALELDTTLISGKILVNIDSEEEGTFYIGCAGGVTTTGMIPVEWTETPSDIRHFKLSVKGLKGGHSGGDIHEQRGNAVKIAARILWELKEKLNLRISGLKGGGLHNAIPRETFASFCVPAEQSDQAREIFSEQAEAIKTEFGSREPDLKIELTTADAAPSRVLSAKAGAKTIDCLLIMPHGVDEMSETIPGLVETSTNLAAAELLDHEVKVLTSQRSSSISKRDYIAARVTTVLRSAGAKVSYRSIYPAWTPDPENPLVPIFKNTYESISGQKAQVTAIHAGLECGVIGDKFQGMTMISFGPDLREVHTPAEQLNLPSLKRSWDLLLRVLKELAKK